MNRLRITAIATAFLSLSLAQVSQALPTTRPVRVTGGRIMGSEDGALNEYFAIPFAAPPVGELRWRAPQPVVPWKGIKTTRDYSPACSQTAAWISHPKSEDHAECVSILLRRLRAARAQHRRQRTPSNIPPARTTHDRSGLKRSRPVVRPVSSLHRFSGQRRAPAILLRDATTCEQMDIGEMRSTI